VLGTPVAKLALFVALSALVVKLLLYERLVVGVHHIITSFATSATQRQPKSMSTVMAKQPGQPSELLGSLIVIALQKP
jgi:hypothetical protein